MPEFFSLRHGDYGHVCWEGCAVWRQPTRVVNVRTGLDGVYIGRPGPWGNPFKVGVDGSRAEVIAQFRAWLRTQPALVARARLDLRGQRLLCWCPPQPCHGDVWVEVVDAD